MNARRGNDGNALQAASGGGHLEIVCLLIEKGAEVNAQGGYYGNALQAALDGGDLEIVHLLIKKGAEQYSTPLTEDSKGLVLNSDEDLPT